MSREKRIPLHQLRNFFFKRVASDGFITCITYSEQSSDPITLLVYDKGVIVRRALLTDFGAYDAFLKRVTADNTKDTIRNIINYIDLYY